MAILSKPEQIKYKNMKWEHKMCTSWKTRFYLWSECLLKNTDVTFAQVNSLIFIVSLNS